MEDESKNQLIEAMFTQQRLQVLSLGISENAFTDHYLYAWYTGVYPACEDTDGSCIKMPHEHYPDQFLTSRQKVEELTAYLDECWQKKDFPTFYELERKFEVSMDRSEWRRRDLLYICRYLKLDDSFDEQLWRTLLTPGQHPSEAQSIIRQFDRNRDINFC